MKLSQGFLWVFLCVISVVNASFKEDEVDYDNAGLLGSGETWSNHRVRLFFPLLMKVSSRLSTLVPSVLMVLMGLFVLVVFSKKALIISLIALYFTLKLKFHKDEKKDVVYVDGYHHHHQALNGHVYGNNHGYEDQHGYYDHYYDHYK